MVLTESKQILTVTGQAEQSGPTDQITVTKLNSSYKFTSQKPSGSFKTGQEADIMLSGVGFNQSGGPLLFNHPGNLTSNGENLILADRGNNRVLIWNELPRSKLTGYR